MESFQDKDDRESDSHNSNSHFKWNIYHLPRNATKSVPSWTTNGHGDRKHALTNPLSFPEMTLAPPSDYSSVPISIHPFSVNQA